LNVQFQGQRANYMAPKMKVIRFSKRRPLPTRERGIRGDSTLQSHSAQNQCMSDCLTVVMINTDSNRKR